MQRCILQLDHGCLRKNAHLIRNQIPPITTTHSEPKSRPKLKTLQIAHDCTHTQKSKAGVAPFLRGRGPCIPLLAVIPPLQVVLSSACSVANLSRYPSHYVQDHPHLRKDALADYPFGRGNPSTWRTGRTTLHDAPPAKPPFGAQRSMTVSRYQLQRQRATQPTRTHARHEPTEPLQIRMEATRQKNACGTRPVAN